MLLDTHVLLWARTSPARLGTIALDRLRVSPIVWFSPVSLVELRIKAMLGKLDAPDEVFSDPTRAGYTELALRATHVDAIAMFDTLARHDPFDRMLLAQAQAEGIDFLTADRRLLDLGHPWILDART